MFYMNKKIKEKMFIYDCAFSCLAEHKYFNSVKVNCILCGYCIFFSMKAVIFSTLQIQVLLAHIGLCDSNW